MAGENPQWANLFGGRFTHPATVSTRNCGAPRQGTPQDGRHQSGRGRFCRASAALWHLTSSQRSCQIRSGKYSHGETVERKVTADSSVPTAQSQWTSTRLLSCSAVIHRTSRILRADGEAPVVRHDSQTYLTSRSRSPDSFTSFPHRGRGMGARLGWGGRNDIRNALQRACRDERNERDPVDPGLEVPDTAAAGTIR
jgi:hypothetical protein